MVDLNLTSQISKPTETNFLPCDVVSVMPAAMFTRLKQN